MPKINEPNFLVTRDFVEAALIQRYQEVKDIWGCEASESLWEQFLDVILDCGRCLFYLFIFNLSKLFVCFTVFCFNSIL